MSERSRGLREAVVKALARVSLVWVLAVLGALFMVTGSQGDRPEGGYSLRSVREAPRTAGLALALVVLAGGATVLAVGAARGPGSTPA